MMKHLSNVQAKIIKHVSCDDSGYVLFDWVDSSQLKSSNLVKCDVAGNILWVAAVVRSNDKYVDFELVEDSKINAWTFSGFKVSIDSRFGNASDLAFTK